MGPKKTLVAALAALFFLWTWGGAGPAAAQNGQAPDLPGTLVQDRIQATGFIAPRPIPRLGTITGSRDASAKLSEGDVVYVTLEPGVDVKAGDHLAIARIFKEVSHPVTRQRLGQVVHFSGRVVILEGAGRIVPAKIEKSFFSIEHGDLIVSPPPPPPLAMPIRDKDDIRGVIVAAAEEEQNISERGVVFIDRGIQDGVIVGDLFSIYQLPYYTREAKESKEKLPLLKVGEGVVIGTHTETSALLVTRSLQAVYVGDTVLSGKGK